MPRSTNDTTLRPDLHVLAVEYIDEHEDFIGLQILPPFGVDIQSGRYPIITQESLLSLPETKRAPRSAYHRGDWEFELGEFDCSENGIEAPLDDVESKLFGRYFDTEAATMQIVLGIVLRNQERRIASLVFNPTTFTPHAVSVEWSNPNATPINDLRVGKLAVHDACGIVPDTLIVTYNTYLNLGFNNQILNRIKYVNKDVSKGDLTPKTMADALGVERLLIGKAMYNTAKKGQPASLSPIWDDEYAMLCVIDDGRDIKTPCIGRTFKWVRDCPANVLVESYREEEKRGEIIRARQHMDEKIILIEAGYLLSNITA